MRFLSCIRSENAKLFVLVTLRVSFFGYNEHILRKCFHNLKIGPQIYQNRIKNLCNIDRIICVACTFHMRWA